MNKYADEATLEGIIRTWEISGLYTTAYYLHAPVLILKDFSEEVLLEIDLRDVLEGFRALRKETEMLQKEEEKEMLVEAKELCASLAQKTVTELSKADLARVRKYIVLQNKIGKLRAQIEEMENDIREKNRSIEALEAESEKLDC